MKRTSMAATLVAAGMAAALLVASAAAESNIGLRAIEGRVGLADLEGDAGSTFIISAAADMGTLTPDLGLEFNIDFLTKSWDRGYDDTSERSITNLAFIANLRYAFKTQSTFHPFAFAGLGFNYWSSDVERSGGGDSEGFSDIEFGLDLGAGADFGSGDGMTPTVRAGFNTNGGWDYLFISGGLKFPIGK
ncbi:MAG: outer membrane beta-barrel protein [Candidatus Eisenbacteria bacterium]